MPTQTHEKFRARQAIPGDYLQTLLNSLTLDEIRDAVYALAPRQRIVVRNHATSLEAVQQTKRSVGEIVDCLLDIECASPFKHCLFFACDAHPQIETIAQRVKESLSAGGLAFRLARVANAEATATLTFEHYVAVHEWIDETTDTKRRQSFSTRHPIVFRLQHASRVATLSYPGYSQGSGVKKDQVLDYPTVLESLQRAMRGMNFAFKAVPVSDALRFFLSSNSTRVKRIRADVESVRLGRFDVASISNHRGVEESLVDFLQPGLAPKERLSLIESTKKALNEADANFIVLFWTLENVYTRLRFWDIGCEVLFVWHGVKALFETVDGIIDLLASAHQKVGEGASGKRAFEWIAQREVDVVVRPADLAASLGLSSEQARAELVYGVRAGLLTPVYRLRTNWLIPGYSNAWVFDPTQLRKVFIADGGEAVDGSDVRQVEVAFLRVGSTR